MILIKEGMKAPFFEGTDQSGNRISLNDFRGKKLDTKEHTSQIFKLYE
ncbi:MAG: hypothetical protein K8R35_00560 [Bacteroidales bacterium]|nr:hypothetical protein [Bacteroidales bacterium]